MQYVHIIYLCIYIYISFTSAAWSLSEMSTLSIDSVQSLCTYVYSSRSEAASPSAPPADPMELPSEAGNEASGGAGDLEKHRKT